MRKLLALVLATLVLGCVSSYNTELTVGVNGSASFNKSFGNPTTTQAKKAATTTLAKKVTTTTLAKQAVATTQAPSTAIEATSTTQAEDVSIGLTFSPDKETVPLSDAFQEDLTFTNLDTAHNYTVVVLMYSPGGSGDGGEDVNMANADPVAREWGIMTFTFGMTITPFTHDGEGFSLDMEHFTRKGEHHYDITVYDCTNILEATGALNCGRGAQKRLFEWENKDGWKGQESVFHLDKVITVT
jgi:hypothetical protein